MQRSIIAFLIASSGITVASNARTSEEPQIIEGTWVYMFEGSNFFEGQILDHSCDVDFDDASWLADEEAGSSFASALEGNPADAEGSYTSKYGTWRTATYRVRFIGYQSIKDAPAGHFGMWDSEYTVERFLLISPIPNVHCVNDR